MTEEANRVSVFVGTYTRMEGHLITANGKGIYVYEFDLSTGELSYQSEIHGVVNPSFLTIGPHGKTLFATSEIGQAEPGGLSSYAIDQKTGDLAHLNTVDSGGSSACYVTVDQTGRYALIANYSSGNVGIFPIRPDGSLAEASDFQQHTGSGPNPNRQEGPHAHCIVIDPTSRYAFAADLGTDQIIGYLIDFDGGKLVPHSQIKLAAGSGPRHLVFHPNGQMAFVIQELSSEITALAYDPELGRFEIIETVSTLPADFVSESHCADIHVSSDGRFLYGSNRGHDSIVIYAIDQTSGHLGLLGHQSTLGEVPRNFVIDPTGTYLLAANQNSDTVVTFRINRESGLLSPTGYIAQAPTPVCLKMLQI
ncbi:MAG: lactonase family protein [Chloroflexota bacterium]